MGLVSVFVYPYVLIQVLVRRSKWSCVITRMTDQALLDCLLQTFMKFSCLQLSFLQHSLANPDVFCLAEFPIHSVNLDILKSPPDDDNRDIATWKSLQLVEILLNLSEHGHYQEVVALFKFPMHNCPDMLVLSLLQVRSRLFDAAIAALVHWLVTSPVPDSAIAALVHSLFISLSNGCSSSFARYITQQWLL